MGKPLPPGSYRPTTLKIASRHCPRAINFYDDDADYDRRIFGVGTAVHAIIQGATEAANALDRPLDADEFDAVSLTISERMIREGRSFEGRPEPPLPADDVWEGRELARRYVEKNPIEPAVLREAIGYADRPEVPDDARPALSDDGFPAVSMAVSMAEVGMAVDADWKPTSYSKGARLRLIADYLAVTEEFDEESSARVLVVRDYKSAWPTDKEELDTVQLRAQAVLAWLHHGNGSDSIDCLCQEVTNLRTSVTYRRELWMLEDGGATIERWQDEIEATMRALDDGRDEAGLYKASPGGGCIGCPYVAHCEVGRAWSDDALEHDNPVDRAAAYMALLARVKAVEAVLRKETENGPIRTPGFIVGTVGKEGRAPVADVWQVLLDEWTSRGGEADGLLSVLDIGVSQLDKVGKALYPQRADMPARKEWLATLVEPKITRRFGVHADEKDVK